MLSEKIEEHLTGVWDCMEEELLQNVEHRIRVETIPGLRNPVWTQLLVPGWIETQKQITEAACED